MKNKNGLSRVIPDPVKREVRARSKFGCVVCRAGVFDYEHIDPEYKDASSHDPDNICCLCSSCHDKVTRRHYSKAFVQKKYRDVDEASPDDIQAPFGFLDFHDGKAELVMGGITYEPGVRCLLKYHGHDFLTVNPSQSDAPGGMSAVFTDSDGKSVLQIKDNVWEGDTGSWDTEVVGPRISVRKKRGQIALRLRLEAPGRIVVERLDMRIGDAHILVSESSHAFGRCFSAEHIHWFHASMYSMGSPLKGAAAIEYLDPYEVEWRDQKWMGRGQRLATVDNQIVWQSGLGVACKPMGIIVGSNCLRFMQGSFAVGGPRLLGKMRSYVFRSPEKVAEFIGAGSIVM